MNMEEGLDVFNDVLEHHGILGQKWGVMNGPPYPLGSGSHSAAEWKAGWKKSLSSAGSALRKGAEGTGTFIKKTAQNTSAEIHRRSEERAEKKREKEENDRRASEEQKIKERREAINTANSQYAEENFSDMSEAELNELLRRVDLKQRVDKVAGVSSGKKTFADHVDNLAGNIDRARKWADTGVNTWNTVAKVYNSFNEDKLPIIDGDMATRKRKEEEELVKAKAKAREAKINKYAVDKDWVKKNIDSMDSIDMKAAANALKNEHDLREALSGNFANKGMTQQDVEDYLKQLGLLKNP